jgi:uncharacterized membrane protein YhaH (DUF805 family)
MDQIDINKIWQNFVDTVTNHYMDFTGRVGRSQFWYYVLVYVVVGIGVAAVGSLLSIGMGLRGLYALAMFLPSVGITARRLQDTGRSGSWAWLLAVPVGVAVIMGVFAVITVLTLGIGAILFLLAPLLSLVSLAAVVVLIYFCAQPGEAAANAYGPPPPLWTPGTPRPTAPAA